MGYHEPVRICDECFEHETAKEEFDEKYLKMFVDVSQMLPNLLITLHSFGNCSLYRFPPVYPVICTLPALFKIPTAHSAA